MLRRIIAVFLILFLGAALASAQGVSRKAGGAGGGGFMFGANRFDLTALNDKLKAKGFESLGEGQVFFGGGGYGLIRGRILLGGEGGGFTRDVVSDTQKATLSGGYGFFNVGYVIFSTGNLKLFPLLGIGGGGFSLRIAERRKSLTFDQVLEEPGQETNMTTGGFLFSFALGADFLLALGEDEEGKGGLLLGIRAGYTFSPTKADWKMGDMDVLGGPDVRMTGPYVHLLLGGGGIGKR